VDPRPAVTRKRWVYITKDIDTFREIRATGRLGIAGWLASLATCRSFAYVSWRDPLPGMHAILTIFKRAFRFMFRSRKSSEADAPTDSSATARSLPR